VSVVGSSSLPAVAERRRDGASTDSTLVHILAIVRRPSTDALTSKSS